jgi:ATP-dependent Clp protease ATP-binding subunit ClpA
MSQLQNPKLGFGSAVPREPVLRAEGKLSEKVERTGLEAARRKFTPEFMNRLDKVVVFKPLGETQLRRILDIELTYVQQRVFTNGSERPFVFTCSQEAKDFLLREGTDLKYGARHLKRAIERLLVQPMSNLIATDQVRAGDWIKVDSGPENLLFSREAEGLAIHAMVELVDHSISLPLGALANAISAEQSRPQTTRASRRS